MSDLISRRKAFEYFVTLWECIGTIMDRDEWEDVCMTTANEIPSAQPETHDKRTEMHACDLIDRRAAVELIERMKPYRQDADDIAEMIANMPPAQPELPDICVGDTISRQAAIDQLHQSYNLLDAEQRLEDLPSAQSDLGKYEYHYDHTDCIWYRPEARNRCPVTCAQYRDGWNDAMNYIFRDGKGYRPYRRGEQYEE